MVFLQKPEESFPLYFFHPSIVLEAGYFLQDRAFFDNIGTILLYAVVVGVLRNDYILVHIKFWKFIIIFNLSGNFDESSFWATWLVVNQILCSSLVLT